MVLTAGVFPSWEDARARMPLIFASAAKYGINLHVYGVGYPHFPSWCDLKIKMQLAYLERHGGGYSHVLYTDGRDAFFTAPLEEIVEKYGPYADQIVVSCGRLHQGHTDWPHCPEHYGSFSMHRSDYVYPHVGGYIGPIDKVLETFRRMATMDRLDDMYVWHDAWVEGWFRPLRDMDCRIFQVLDFRTEEDGLTVKDGRLFNQYMKQYPCIFHLSGGYSDPVKGKPEWIGPWWRRLHPDLAEAMPA